MRMYRLLFLFVLAQATLFAQQGATLLHNDRVAFRNGPASFNPDWAPFFHGVASGDPMADRVIIWTRVTPETMDNQPVEVNWRVATDTRFRNVVRSGSFTTNADRDYTVKVDVDGLEAGKTYYYVFQSFGKNSLVGRTKTTPTGDQASHLKFAIVSCSNYQAGYFTNYRHIAARNDLDAVIHLGDYIYEYDNRTYGDSSLREERRVEPDKEIVTLEDYRTRYSTYRLDTNLVRAHQQHPFVAVWDDHESANDAFKDGAENHDSTEGDWDARKAVSKQVYFEWMPIRDTEDRGVYRTLNYGNLMDLIMLDTRLEGREIQINNVNDPALQDSTRTILGAEQKNWLLDQLRNSTARWKVIGQQVIFSQLNVGWAALVDPTAGLTYFDFESLFLDIWDGYPAERRQIINHLKNNQIDNVVILTGDFHSSFAFDVADDPVKVAFQNSPFGTLPVYSSPDYDPATGRGSVAVEFACPSVTSANFDENVSLSAAQGFQAQINRPIVPIPGISLGNPNLHMKYTDLIRHGYFILDVKPDSVQANYYYAPILTPAQPEAFDAGLYSKAGENFLNTATAESGPKAVQDEPAPNAPLTTTSLKKVEEPRIFALLGVYPNPFQELNTLHYSLSQPAQVNIGLFDASGKLLRTLVDQRLQPGIFSLELNAAGLAKGTYVYKIQVDRQVYTAKVVLVE